MSKHRTSRRPSQGGTTPRTAANPTTGVAQFSMSEVAQFSVSLDTGRGFRATKEGKKPAKGDFRGIKLSNDTHRSGTDLVDAVFSEGVALLCRKSKAHPALPSYRLIKRNLRYDRHGLMDNRHVLIVDCCVTQATGTGERDAAKVMAADRPGPTLLLSLARA